MVMTVLEVAVYAAILGGGEPMLCRVEGAVVSCSNGYTAQAISDAAVRFGDGVVVSRGEDGFPRFSNGVRSWFDSARWLQFSNGMAVRRTADGEFLLSSGVTCRSELPTLVNCVRTPGAPGQRP